MIHFCTFGNVPAYSRSINELCTEAIQSGYFNTITSYDQSIIPDEHKTFIQNNPRGYGYWLWKVIIILEQMKNAKEGDIIIYADAGCGISTTNEAREKFKEWIESVKNHPTHRISFQMPHIEETWTKADLFKIMDCDTDEYKKTGQTIGGIQIYQVTQENVAFLNEVLQYMCMDNYHLITDAPSKIPNASTFRDHRHDQSVLSLMFKKKGSHVYEDHWEDYAFPIVAIRRKY